MTFDQVTIAVFSPGSVELDMIDGQEICGASVSDYDMDNMKGKHTIVIVISDSDMDMKGKYSNSVKCKIPFNTPR